MVEHIAPTGTPSDLAALGYTDNSWDRPWNLARGQLTTTERMPSAVLAAGDGAQAWPRGPQVDLSALAVSDPLTGRPTTLADLLRDRLNNDAFLIVHNGRILAEEYANGMRADDRHLVHSCSKTLTTMMVGVAADEGRLDLSAPVTDAISELRMPAWEGVTVQHVLDMATGIDTEEHYEDLGSMYWRYADAVGYYGPTDPEARGVLGFAAVELDRRAVAPGTVFNYASYLTNLLPLLLERGYGMPAVELYEQRIYRLLGAEQNAIINLDRFGNPIVEGQVNLSLRDFARWAGLYVDGGLSQAGTQVLPSAWVDDAFRPDPSRRAAFERSDYAALMPGSEYHNQAWLIDPDGGVLAMLGIHGQFAFIDPARRLMMVGLSSYPDQANPLMVATLGAAWEAVGHLAS